MMKYIIYGAYGYTGQLIVEEAIKRGHKPVVAGRDEAKVEEVAARFGLESVSFRLGNPEEVDRSISEFDLVLHAAGPYSVTAPPMVEACLRTKTHYVDITGEIDTFEFIAAKDNEAKQAGIILLPGAGFDVVPTDCLAAFLHKQLPNATHLEMGFQSMSKFSRGTALTMTESLPKGGMIRQDGKIRYVKSGYQTRVKERDGRKISFASIPWGDVSTAFHSTGIPNIMLFFGTHPKVIKKMKRSNSIRWFLGLRPVQNHLKRKVRKTVKGPTAEIRETVKSFVWGEVINAKGEKKAAELITLEGYKLTALTSVETVDRLLTGALKPGFYTPSKAFGEDYILQFGNTKRSMI
ncbi:MAG: saccharopine dehydrogenase family protein [Cyclobacteriaceae bacterium]